MPTERRRRLKELEGVISSGFDQTAAAGRALREIRDEGLYHELGEKLTFEQYVKTRWSLPIRTAYQQIDAADISDAISVCADEVPILNEGVGRELAQVLHEGGAERVAEAWSQVVDRYRGQRPPTASEVYKVLVEEGYRKPTIGPSSGKVNRRIKLGQFGDKLVAADKRLDWFVAKELGDKPLGKADKKLAGEYADRCEQMARRLREIAS